MKQLYYALLLLTSMLWAGNFVAGKFMVGHASPFVLTELRWMLAVLILAFIVYYQERSFKIPKEAILPLMLMGLTGIIFFNVFLYLALEHTSADTVGLLSTLNPISIAVMSFIFLREKLTFRQMIAMFISLAGVFIVLTNGQFDDIWSHTAFNIGDIYMLIAVLVWGGYSVAGKIAMKYVSPYMSTFWSGIFGSLFLLPFTAKEMISIQGPLSFWTAVAYTVVGSTVLAMVFWNIGVHHIGGTTSGMFLNFNPLFTAIFAYFLLGETLGVSQFIGAIMIILGVLSFTRNVETKSIPIHERLRL
jgi:drug/metabolite transporter (DMT)-like permease